MRVRDATPADAEAISRVSTASCRAAYEGVVDDPAIVEATEGEAFTEDVREWLVAIQDDHGVVYLVAERGGRVVGFAQFVVDPDRVPDHVGDREAYLQSLYVHPDHWGEGVGTALLEAGRSRLPDRTAAIRLDVLADNDRGRGFYEDRGFSKAGEGTYEVGDVVYETTIYEGER